ncbi:hypothetical protein LEP1GSC202_1992 [Leptospira yanagawae serovar Saopaulo str. Sao Paulo = ATCC 700523]|uniref:Uncharacterized protein n=1 Tax=Leptospira yanagawae serovar Saopaulo str. Sao Paulo = ATCC 700523 TaxID=1249483 RepID=A0A5E8HC99_9LEPT|nr:hypothetical protein LEP1GSC202_1992 [Leptospira yanagawae serovar Saopaulo str. Sao Paulo = ATCC 700523]
MLVPIEGNFLKEHWKRILVFMVIAVVYCFWVFIGYNLVGILSFAS